MISACPAGHPGESGSPPRTSSEVRNGRFLSKHEPFEYASVRKPFFCGKSREPLILGRPVNLHNFLEKMFRYLPIFQKPI